MKKIYFKFVISVLVYSSGMFLIWSLVAGIDNAREMIFVISVLASCISAKTLMSDVLKLCEKDEH